MRGAFFGVRTCKTVGFGVPKVIGQKGVQGRQPSLHRLLASGEAGMALLPRIGKLSSTQLA